MDRSTFFFMIPGLLTTHGVLSGLGNTMKCGCGEAQAKERYSIHVITFVAVFDVGNSAAEA